MVTCGLCGVPVPRLVQTALLAEAGVDSSDCVEKEELVQKVVVRLDFAFCPGALYVYFVLSNPP